MPGIDANTKLLINFNGANNATSYTAETGQTVTFRNGAKISTDQSQIVASSLYLDGVNDDCTVPDNDNWCFSSANFTIDTWVRFNSTSGIQIILSQNKDGTTGYWHFRWRGDLGQLQFNSANTSASTGAFYCSPSFSTNTWYHLAVQRNGSACNVFVDGVPKSVTQTAAWSTLYNVQQLLRIGSQSDSAPEQFFNGYIGITRISLTARYPTDGFTPPTSVYTEGGDGGFLTTNKGWM
jgi:hypothetical protein